MESGTPGWWSRAAAALDRARNDRDEVPRRLVTYATTAALPAPGDYPGALAFHAALGVPVVSDGAHWFPISVGAHL